MDINYLSVAILLLFIVMTVRGYRRGFLRMVVTFLGTILILSAAKRVSPYISEYMINNTSTYETVQTKITEKFAEANQRYDNTIPENQAMTIEGYDLPDLLKNNLLINNTKEMYNILLVSVFEEYVSAYLAKTAIKAMAFVLVFVVFIVAFKILLLVVDIISKIPIIRGINEFVGACLGFIESLIIVWVFFFIVVMFIGNNSGSVLFSMIASSKFLSFLFNTNLLLGIIS